MKMLPAITASPERSQHLIARRVKALRTCSQGQRKCPLWGKAGIANRYGRGDVTTEITILMMGRTDLGIFDLSARYQLLGYGQVLEQTAVHEDIRAANPLHEVESASVVEKTRQIHRQLARSTEDTP
jgi:hypothetical protein